MRLYTHSASNIFSTDTKCKDKERHKKKKVLRLLDKSLIFNTGNVSNVSNFISDQYFDHESQIDLVRSKLGGPTEFIDTVEKNRMGFPDLHHQEVAIAQYDTGCFILNVTGTQTGNFFILPLLETRFLTKQLTYTGLRKLENSGA